MLIAIDGPAASGKSTIAREVAKKLNYKFISTGAMYRAITYRVLKDKIDAYNEEAPAKIAKKYGVSFQKTKDHPEEERVFIDNEDVTEYLFTPEVDSAVSLVARNPQVRKELVRQQRRISSQGNMVMEGRDIGTVVLPEADFKIYLTATAKERALRRKKDLEKKGYYLDEERLKREIVYRDKIDSTREHSPLVKAGGALLINTTNKTIEQVIDMVMDIVKNRE